MVDEKPLETNRPRIGVFVCHCGSNIASVVAVPEVVDYAQTLPGVVIAREHRYMCSDPGQALIQAEVKQHGLDRVVVAACSVAMPQPHLPGIG